MRASTTSGCVARQRRYSSMNCSESGCPLSISMACASDMGAGTSSSTLRVGLYHRIVVADIGSPLSSEVSVHHYTITSLGLVWGVLCFERRGAPVQGILP